MKTISKSTTAQVCGTSFWGGVIKGSAVSIGNVLGECDDCFDEGKTRFEWDRKCQGVVFTVYDYKVFPSETDVIEYHIGTHSYDDTVFIVSILKETGINAYIN